MCHTFSGIFPGLKKTIFDDACGDPTPPVTLATDCPVGACMMEEKSASDGSMYFKTVTKRYLRFDLHWFAYNIK